MEAGMNSRSSRRTFLHLAAGAVALPAVSRGAWAQAYPTRPVRLIIGYTPGGSADITARLTGQWLSERLGQSVVVESRPGGGTNIATEAVVRAAPDGYTLLLVAPANAINATLYDKLGFDFLRDIVPVAGIIRFPNVVDVNPSLPIKSIPELIAYAKVNPGKLNIPTSADHVRSGRLRGLAVTGTARSPVLPDLPTVAEFLPGYEASAWYGLGAPRNTPAAIVERINAAVNAILADPASQARFTELGASLLPGSPADFGKLLADETEKWGKVVKFAGAKPE
jgi:tripartite-type tricarboxylate transporter receptor subunit TctC